MTRNESIADVVSRIPARFPQIKTCWAYTKCGAELIGIMFDWQGNETAKYINAKQIATEELETFVIDRTKQLLTLWLVAGVINY